MTAATERQTAIHIHITEAAPQDERSYPLKKVLQICCRDQHWFWEQQHGEFADFWRADNHKETIHEPGKPGRKKRPDPRFAPEHVEYMLAVINGLIDEAEARDLWELRKNMIRSKLTSGALTLATGQRKAAKK